MMKGQMTTFKRLQMVEEMIVKLVVYYIMHITNNRMIAIDLSRGKKIKKRMQQSFSLLKNAELSNSQLNKLKSTTKITNKITLGLSSNIFVNLIMKVYFSIIN